MTEKQHDNLPEELRQRLAEWDDARLFVPQTVDNAVLGAARQRMADIRRKRRRPVRRLAWCVGPVAAAALIGLVIWAVDPFGTVEPWRPTILDAFTLARQKAAGDTTITQQQIDRLAQQAVSVSRASGGSS